MSNTSEAAAPHFAEIPDAHLDVTPVHGGESFAAIGEDFEHLERTNFVVNADVLDAWFDPSPKVLEKLERFLPFLVRTSPPLYAAGLVSAIARARGLRESCILTGGGSSNLIFTCFPRLFGKVRKAMILDPTYSEYRHVLSEVMGIEVTGFDLHKEENFCVNTDRLLAQVLARAPELVVIANPNSPSGQYWPRREMIRFLDTVRTSTMVVIDETYIEYAGGAQSIENEACERPNLLVLKSMSKVYALSGMRVGYLVAEPSTIRSLAKWLPPWAVSLPAQVAAVEALTESLYYQHRHAQTRVFREELVRNIRRHSDCIVYPSSINLVLIETDSGAQQIVERMRRSHVFVRNCDSMSPRFQDRFIRIAVKRPRENARIVEALCSPASRKSA